MWVTGDDHPLMQPSIERLQRACEREGCSVTTVLERPLPAILAFAQRHHISVLDLVAICGLLLARLDDLEAALVAGDGMHH